MESNEKVILGAAVIALLGSLLSLFISTRLAVHKERRQLLWGKELDRFFELEELAGDLVEDLSGYKSIPEDGTILAQRLESFKRFAGRFGRYPDVRQAIRDLHNTLERMFAAKRDRQDEEQIRSELEPALRSLLSACDKVVERYDS